MATNYQLVRTHLINAFTGLDGETLEGARLRRAVEVLLEAVDLTECDNAESNIVPFPGNVDGQRRSGT